MFHCFGRSAGTLLRQGRSVFVIPVGVHAVPRVTTLTELLLSASVSDLVPEWSMGGQSVEQTLSTLLDTRVSSECVCPLWLTTHPYELCDR